MTKDCAQLLSLGQKFSAAVQAASGGGSAEAVAKEVQLFKELADASPSDIHADFETIADAFAASATALKKADLTPGQTPTAKQLAQLAGGKQVVQLGQGRRRPRSTWRPGATKNCGGLNTTTR